VLPALDPVLAAPLLALARDPECFPECLPRLVPDRVLPAVSQCLHPARLPSVGPQLISSGGPVAPQALDPVLDPSSVPVRLQWLVPAVPLGSQLQPESLMTSEGESSQ
jgi:hypothetical protein